ncbi:MAG: AMP-binding protein [Caulobacteraceae bacterium]|nr:AMP-binding protein [Caulobacteraceae bacterium]
MRRIISGDRQRSFDEIGVRARRAATGLHGMGVGSGDAIAVMLRNDFAFFEASEAANQLGAYTVLVNWHFTPEEVNYILTDSGAKVLIVHADLYDGVRDGVPAEVKVVLVRTPPEAALAYGLAERPIRAGEIDWDAWLGGFAEWREPQPIQPGAVYYTSGTTGRPKGVKRTITDPAQMTALSRLTSRMFGLEPAIFGGSGERVATVICGPMYHGGPNAAARLNLLAGADIHLQPKFDPEDLLRIIEREQITHLYMVPTMFVRLLRLPEPVKARYDTSSLRWVIHTAAPCPPHVKRAMIEWWGPVINEYYAATETFASAFISSEEWLAHPGSVGRPPEGVVVKTLDDEGRVTGLHQPGEIFARAEATPDFTYHNAPAKRRDAERDGFVSVGDVGYFDEDGYLYLCDRKSQMVISGGVNIYPAEIEAELLKMPGVADAAVFGVPDEEFGESLAAHIQLAPDQTIAAEDVRAFLSARLAKYKAPRTIVFEAELPREDSGKIFKRKLREPYWAEAGRNI